MKRYLRQMLAAAVLLVLLGSLCVAYADTTATVLADTKAYSTSSMKSSEVLGTLRKDTKVDVRAVSRGIAKIVYKGKTCFVDESKLSIQGSVAPSNPAQSSASKNTSPVDASVVATNLVVFEKASKSAKQLGTLHKGAKVQVHATSGQWAAIQVGSKFGYCGYAGLDIHPSNIAAAQAASKTETAPAPAQSSTTQYQVNGTGACITLEAITMYKTTSTSGGSYGTFKAGAQIDVTAVSGKWAKVVYKGKTGYVKRAALKPADSAPAAPVPTQSSTTQYQVNGKGVCITLETVTMYKTTSTSGGSYGTFKAGAQIDVTAVSGKWAKVVYKGKTGYVKRTALKPADTAPAPGTTVAPAAQSGTTHETTVKSRLYTKPNTSSNAVAILQAGVKLQVKATSGGWAKVLYNGANRYILAENLREAADHTEGMIVVEKALVYEQPTLAAAQIGTIAEGTQVQIFGKSNGWAKVDYNGKRAYVQLTSIFEGKAAYSQLASGDSGTAVQTLQNRLETLGYFDGVPAGNYGTITVAAVKRFQQQTGLAATGTANNATQAVLYAKNAPTSKLLGQTLSQGSSGDSVTRLQTRLLYKNYYRDSIDGDFGNNTIAAVKAFQKKAGLPETGTANPVTLKALFAPNAPKGENVRPVGSNGTPSLDPPDVRSDNEDIETVISHALAQLGKPYVYGTQGPNSFDCSGLTYYCFKKVGITLPRTAYDVGYSSALGARIPYDQLRRGDIVCFNTISDSDLSDHVGIYLGDGKFIHAPHTGSDVIVANMASGYYVRNFSWARRVIK